jgi:hypothetical protein
MEELEAYVLSLFKKQDTPLDRMYDSWHGGNDDWREGAPMTRHILYAKKDVNWRGRVVLVGQPFPCHLCGEIDLWTAGGHENGLAFVCVHEPIDIGRGKIPQVSSVAINLVGRYKIVR